MSNTFDINIGTRKITVTPGEGVETVRGEVTGTFSLTENGSAAGIIRFDQQSWENEGTGDLSYIELEAIAENIMFRYE